MADASDTTAAPERHSDEADTPPAGRPNWVEVDIFADPGPQNLAGGALLAELGRAYVERREEASELDEAEAEALTKLAVADEDHFQAEMGTPAGTLAGTVVKLAGAYRAAWWGNHGNGAYGDAALALVASAMSDPILMRAAEAERRRRLVEPMR